MRVLSKKIISVMMVLCSLTLFADDFGTSFGDDSSSFGDDSGFGGFSDGFGDSEESALEVSGEVNIGLKGFFADDILEQAAEFDPEASITLSYTGSLADLTIVADANTDEVTLDEIYTNIYADKFNVEAGILKTVWGKGDKLHVVDLLNSTDYSNYFTEDYLESKKATAMVKVNVPLGVTGILELAYVPMFEGDTIPSSGVWTPNEVSTKMTALETVVATTAATAYGSGTTFTQFYTALKALQDGSDTDNYYPDTNTLEYGQAGARVTGTLGSFDLGVLYYFGYDKQPTFNYSTMMFEYEQMQMFGIELGKVLGGFNLRYEAAYYLMDDSDDSLNYLAGFDYNLPVSNLNINVQLKGNYMLDSDEDNVNLLVGKLSDKYNHEKVSASVTGLYYLEDQDYMIKPEVTTTIGDTLTLELSSGIFFGDDDTTIGQYDDNDYISINLNYMF